MIINDAMSGLRAIHEAMGAHFVDHSCGAAGEAVYLVDGFVGKNLVVRASVRQVPPDVLADLRSVVVRQLALNVDSLADGRVCLERKAVPQFALSDQDESHGTLRIHAEVKHEPYLLQHFAVEEVGFVHDANGLHVVNAAHKLDFSVQLPLCVTAVELRLTTKLLEEPLVKVTGCEL